MPSTLLQRSKKNSTQSEKSWYKVSSINQCKKYHNTNPSGNPTLCTCHCQDNQPIQEQQQRNNNLTATIEQADWKMVPFTRVDNVFKWKRSCPQNSSSISSNNPHNARQRETNYPLWTRDGQCCMKRVNGDETAKYGKRNPPKFWKQGNTMCVCVF